MGDGSGLHLLNLACNLPYLYNSTCIECRGCGRGRGNTYRAVRGRKTRVGGWRADLNLTCSISPATHCICKIVTVVSAVAVGEGREMLTAQLEAVEREWGDGGWI
jgi:hypothetical protein